MVLGTPRASRPACVDTAEMQHASPAPASARPDAPRKVLRGEGRSNGSDSEQALDTALGTAGADSASTRASRARSLSILTYVFTLSGRGHSQSSPASEMGGVASSTTAPWWAPAPLAPPSQTPCRARARRQGRSPRVGWQLREARRRWRCGSRAPHARRASRPVPVGRSEGAVMSTCMQGRLASRAVPRGCPR